MARKHQHDALFDAEELEALDWWRDLWVDMPAFSSRDEKPYDSIKVRFSNAEDRREFLTMLGEDPARRLSIWYPGRKLRHRRHPDAPGSPTQPRYPVYVISKGRATTHTTAPALDRLRIDYRLVVEPTERDAYAEHVDESKILVLPFADLGQGSIPARNWVWEHATASGARRHWILDDNIRGFYRWCDNERWKITAENPFESVERWVDRYENVPKAGLQYICFSSIETRMPPLQLNTRVYSCILLSNELGPDWRWRGRYNEDTDLSLRFLKAGFVTALFQHYLIDKAPTMTMGGGNTDELYEQTDEFDGRLAMAESLAEQHPDVATVTRKWGRWQHHVDYRPFKSNRPKPVEADT